MFVYVEQEVASRLRFLYRRIIRCANYFGYYCVESGDGMVRALIIKMFGLDSSFRN